MPGRFVTPHICAVRFHASAGSASGCGSVSELSFFFLLALGFDNLIDWDSKSPEVTLMKYMEDKRAKEDKVFEDPMLMKTPVVRNGKQATVGYCPEVWAKWE